MTSRSNPAVIHTMLQFLMKLKNRRFKPNCDKNNSLSYRSSLLPMSRAEKRFDAAQDFILGLASEFIHSL